MSLNAHSSKALNENVKGCIIHLSPTETTNAGVEKGVPIRVKRSSIRETLANVWGACRAREAEKNGGYFEK